MARPPVIRDSTIVEAARAVFLERGAQATTAQVALRAGVSEGSIFKRFRSKAELFEAAMGSLEDPPLIQEIERRAGRGQLTDNLMVLGQELMAFLRFAVPLSMMHWSNPRLLEGEPRFLCGQSPTALKLLAAFTAYFAEEMRLGRIRRHDPEIVARAFLGAIHNYVVFEILYARVHPPPDARDFLRGLLRVALEGLDPASPDTRGRSRRRTARTRPVRAPVSVPRKRRTP